MTTAYKDLESIVVVLDDGHDMDLEGSKQTPFIPELGRRIKENEFNRAITDRLAHHLRKRGVKVVLSAPGDRFTSLPDRVRTAKRARATLFVSNHYDAFDGKFDDYDPHGFTVFVANGSPKADKHLAQKILGEMRQTEGQRDRGMKRADFYVLSKMPAHIPAVLVENGFMDNRKEALLMVDDKFIETRALQQYRAICRFLSISPAMPKPPSRPKREEKPDTRKTKKSGKKTLAQIIVPELNLHNKKDLTGKTVVGSVRKGEVFTVVSRGTVTDGTGREYPLVKIKSGYWISANPKHVRLYEK